ncbi:hypothetical protein HN51_033908 [Arachis hypogaea]|uniref:MOM1 alpha-helical domain-containing protein n=1 Tax=Arachis hypogaea TaxID=3818 RepID=A0A445AA20_ARAHY|nr:helicase protein MOM1 [Arachis ipaensis]QHN98664.1 Helicase protein [Arachis hypogaea]RYR23296.1 hypothetical protein Ahy_B03g068538 [Arachis hypogaea]
MKTVPTTPIARNRRSERLEKKTPPPSSAAPAPARGSSDLKKVEKSASLVPTPLRRSGRLSSSGSPSKGSNSKSFGSCSTEEKRKCVKRLRAQEEEEEEMEEGSEKEERAGSDSKVNKKRLHARVYRASLKSKGDFCGESNKMDKSTQEGDKDSGSKTENDSVVPSGDDKAKEMIAESRFSDPVEDLLLENNVAPCGATTDEARLASESNQSDCRGEETPETAVSRNTKRSQSRLSGPPEGLSEKNASSAAPQSAPQSDHSDCNGNETSPIRNSVFNESLIQKRVSHDRGENLIPSKRKGTMVDMHSDVSATSVDDENCNLAVDADPSKLCGSTGGTNGPCSKRIRRISLSDVQSDQRKLISNVDQLSPGVDGVKLSSRDKEGKSQGNDAEYIRKQQRCLILLLQPEIAKLCELLLLPDNVKKMADSCLQYVLNNRQICTKPVSILQAFQLSLCWTAASLLKHKLDFEASIKLAKQHLNFTCKKEMVDEIYSMLLGLREEILSHICGIIDSSKAPESSNRVYSYSEVAPVVDSANKDTPESTKEIPVCENQEGNIHLMLQEEKQKLKAAMEKEKTEFERRVKLQWAAIRCCSPNDVTRSEKLKLFTSEYEKRVRELNRQHEIRLKDLEAKQLKSLQKPNIVEAISRPGSEVGLSKSPDNSVAFPADTLSKPWYSREQCSGGATSAEDEAQGSEKVSCESRNGEICDQETSDVPNGEAALSMCKFNNLNDDQDEVPPSLNSQSSSEHVPCLPTTSMVSCKEATVADESNVSINVETPNLPSSDEGIASLNLRSPQNCAYSLNELCLQSSEKSAQTCKAVDGNGSNNAVSQNSRLTDERIAAGTTVGVPDGEAHVDMLGTVSDSHCRENITAVNPSSSMQQIPDGVVNVLDLEELYRPCVTDGNAITILNQPSLEKQNHDGLSSSTIPAGEITIEVPETALEASIVVSDRELSVEILSSPLNQTSVGAFGQSNTTPLPTTPSLPQQIPDAILPCMPDGQISAEVSETSHEVAECQLTETVNTSTTSDQQEGVVTMTENTSVQETAISRPVDITEPLEQSQPTSSVQSLPDTDRAREVQNSLVSGPVDIVLDNQSNNSSQVVEPQEQVQQLPAVELLPSNQDLSHLPLAAGVEHQQTNGDTVHSHHLESSSEVSNEAVGRQSSTSELVSHSHQDVQTASNLGLVSSIPGGVRAQSSDSRNLSTSSGVNNLHIQTAGTSASGIVPPISRDPLKNELDRIRRLGEKNMKNHEDARLQLNSDYEKELAELRRKYEVKLLDAEVVFQQQKMELDTYYKTVLLNQALAEAFRIKNHSASGKSGMQKDASFTQQLLQFITQRCASRPPQVGSPSRGPIGRSHPVAPPPLRLAYNTTGVFSSVPARSPHPHPMPSSSVNFEASGEIRAPAPHLQPYRPSTPVPASGTGTGTVPPGMPTHPALGNISLNPVSLPSQPPLQLPRHHQPDPHRGLSPVTSGGLPPPNLSANNQSDKNAPNILPRLSQLASLDLMARLGSGSNRPPPNASVQATSDDVVCLSDDDE